MEVAELTPVYVDVLAQNNFGDTRTGGLIGPLGLLIIVLMTIATVLLIRNMNKRLRRLPDSFAPPADPPVSSSAEAGEAEDGSDGERKVLDPTVPVDEAAPKEESGSAPKN